MKSSALILQCRHVQNKEFAQKKMKNPFSAGMICFYEKRMNGESQSDGHNGQLISPGPSAEYL